MPGNFTSPLAEALSEPLLARFLAYVRVDTQSDPAAGSLPSTPGQRALAETLRRELAQLGAEDAALTPEGTVLGTLPARGADSDTVVAWMAHLDTSPDAPGAGVEPLVHRGYDGGEIRLPRRGTTLDPARMPELRGAVGHDLVTSSGDTLLGADDKAGMAEIMTAVAHLAAHPELPRPTLRVCFLPDEEVGGRGAQALDLDRLDARCGYTMDGSGLGELQDESFSAQEVVIALEGVGVHPGQAKGKLVNALRLAAEIVSRLPRDSLSPETSDEREGFLHAHSLQATAAGACLRVLVRDFDDGALAEHAALLRRIAEGVVEGEPRARLEFRVHPQYRNMRHFLARDPAIVAAAERALRAEGLEPWRRPIRGGTDGSILSERGLPTPNLFTGGHEYHSPREWASLQEMSAAAATLVRLAGVWAGGGSG